MSTGERAIFRGAPTFVRAFVLSRELRVAGHWLAGSTYSALSEEGADCEEAFDALVAAAQRGDRRAVLDWYKDRFPGVMVLVPLGCERKHFVDGVFDSYDERNLVR